MEYLSNEYAKVFSYKGFDICTLKSATPQNGDSLGYVIDHEDFSGKVFNLVEDAIRDIDITKGGN